MMSGGAILGLLLVLVILLLVTVLIERARWERRWKKLVLAGLWLRVAGALGYFFYISSIYGGGDYLLYYGGGLEVADTLTREGFGAFLDSLFEKPWWGTSFTMHLAGVVLSVIGPTLPGAFIVFAVLGYVGIVALGFAFKRAFPLVDWRRYMAWIVLFPPLWFWPAALGKDAIVLCGVGLATLGFVGKHGRIGWLLLSAGVLLVFCVRPQVAATLAFAVAASFWMAVGVQWSAARVCQGALLLGAGVGVIVLSSGAIGVGLFDQEQVEGYLDRRANLSARGGSAIDEGGARWLAPINTLFRPFPWEVSSATTALASVEVVVLWGLAWFRRRKIMAFVRSQRRSRLFWMALVFVAVYATALGMSISNMGIIARQRVHILPFLFMFIAGGAASVARRPRRALHANHPAVVSRANRPAGVRRASVQVP